MARCVSVFDRMGGLVVGLAFLASCASGRSPAGRSVVLPASDYARVLMLCSREGPRGVEGSWEVSAGVVLDLERDLPKLARLRSSACCLWGGRVRDPGSYYRQYVGIVVGSRRLVYVNAFRSLPGPSWRSEPVGGCDGGEGHWGVVYDPATRRFSDLAFNGEA